MHISSRIALTGLVVTALASFAGGAVATTLVFNDVPSDHWAATAISAVRDAGIMQGTNGRFRPNESVSRAELAVVVNRLLEKMGQPNGNVDAPEAENSAPDADDDMAMGDEGATVTLIEFSDFQCPFCKRFHDETLPLIKKDFIDTGKVRFVLRDYPLSFHVAAYPSAVAVECAHAQSDSAAWNLADVIFGHQEDLTKSGLDERLKSWAHALSGLNDRAFDACYDGDEPADEIAGDMDDGVASGINGTPGFWVVASDGRAKMISGAQPYDEFRSTINRLLQP